MDSGGVNGEIRYEYNKSSRSKKYQPHPICTACWREAHGGEWPTGQFLPNVPTEICYRCGHETESGLIHREIITE